MARRRRPQLANVHLNDHSRDTRHPRAAAGTGCRSHVARSTARNMQCPAVHRPPAVDGRARSPSLGTGVVSDRDWALPGRPARSAGGSGVLTRGASRLQLARGGRGGDRATRHPHSSPRRELRSGLHRGRQHGVCRILQSYIERYALADSLEGKAHAGVGRIPATDFARSLQQIGDHHLANRRQRLQFQTHDEERRLFGGALFAEKDVEDDHVNLKCDSTADIRTAADQRESINERLTGFADTWNRVSAFPGTPSQWFDTGD
jgi:hypothetical protein